MSVLIEGVVGRKANLLNGVYEPTHEWHNGKPLFQKQGDPDKWLRFDLDNQWVISPTASKEANNSGCWCHSVESDIAIDHPIKVKSWTIYANGSDDKWEVHAAMKCGCFQERPVCSLCCDAKVDPGAPQVGMAVTATCGTSGAPKGENPLSFTKGTRLKITKVREENGNWFATGQDYGTLWFPLRSTDWAGEKTTEKCKHARTVCDGCLGRHVEAEVRNKGNCKTITCPEPYCKSVMEHHEVQRWAIASVFEDYDQLLLRDCLQRDEEFRWCARPGCGAGQKHPFKDRLPIMACFKCKSKTCFTHRCEWHEGRTCSKYDQDAKDSEEVALLQALDTIKKCPGCSNGIEKIDGCDHMTCKVKNGVGGCGHEFCWRCLAPYNGADGIRQMGNSAHTPTCVYHK
jgi:hypothetical protein